MGKDEDVLVVELDLTGIELVTASTNVCGCAEVDEAVFNFERFPYEQNLLTGERFRIPEIPGFKCGNCGWPQFQKEVGEAMHVQVQAALLASKEPEKHG